MTRVLIKYLWLSVTGQSAYEMYDTDPDWAPSLMMGHEELKSDAKRFERQRECENKKGTRSIERKTESRGENKTGMINFMYYLYI
jgi:hypothetical protein